MAERAIGLLLPFVVMRRRRYAVLVDALRRSNELLSGGSTAYHHAEVEHIRAVNFRLLREVDPHHTTDMTVA